MTKRIIKYFLFMLGWLFVALGLVGAVLPLLPTVPFMIVALWCFASSSDRFHDWLYHHRVFGPSLRLWKRHHVIPLNAKLIALTSMILSLCYMIFISQVDWWVILTAATIMLVGATYILTKPSKPPAMSSSKS